MARSLEDILKIELKRFRLAVIILVTVDLVMNLARVFFRLSGHESLMEHV